jgi:hypothetical protein
MVLQVLLPRLVQEGVLEIAVGRSWINDDGCRRLYQHSPGRYLMHRLVAERDSNFGEVAVPRVTLIDPAPPSTPLPKELWELTRPFHLLLVPADVRDPYQTDKPLAGQQAPMTLDHFLEVLNR